jgi:DNA (cytosine-5)-methyltransferase 1
VLGELGRRSFQDDCGILLAGVGIDDERRIAEAFRGIIASSLSWKRLDLVQTDLETLDYRVAAVAFPASSVGGPHIRDRLYWVGDSSCSGLEGHSGNGSQAGRTGTARPATSAGLHDSQPPPVGKVDGFWRNADWLRCRDGLWRAVEPGTQPLADRITSRVGRLRAYGNAINAEAAKAFIESYLDTF